MTEAKLPVRPPDDLPSRTPDWAAGPPDPFWTIADSAGPYPVRFGQMRSYGPLPTARFDPQPEPASSGSGELVLYVAGDLLTSFAERYQQSRAVRLGDSNEPVAYAWRPTRELRLIDLTGVGALRMGASHTINTGPKVVTRRWARAIRAAWPGADGLLYSSSLAGRSCVALWAPAAPTFPPNPDLALPIASKAAAWQRRIQAICIDLGYTYWP